LLGCGHALKQAGFSFSTFVSRRLYMQFAMMALCCCTMRHVQPLLSPTIWPSLHSPLAGCEYHSLQPRTEINLGAKVRAPTPSDGQSVVAA